MATALRSRSLERARARKRSRRPTRAQRRAGALRHADAAALWYELQLIRLARAFSAAVRGPALAAAERVGTRADAADGGGVPDGARRALRSKAKALVSAAADGAAERTKRHSKQDFARLGIQLRKAEPSLTPLIDRFRRQNVELVTGMLDEQFDKLDKILSDGEGRRAESLAKDIEHQLEVTEARARLIARDQVLTLNAKIAQARMRAAGVQRGAWTTAGDERVRESHREMDGVEFALDDPPTVDGDKVLPGEPVNCRCTTFPILPELATAGDEETAAAAE